jgi:hypothetical protein
MLLHVKNKKIKITGGFKTMAFKVQKAVREKIYTKVALMAPSGGGKTYSALRLATGMREELEKITGKPCRILLANTEGARGRYYANEFDYDIVDLVEPFNPEQFSDVIDFAVEEKYDILIMDSTSPEWDGKGGCLELQQKAGGTYQAWAKVTPRHDAFINKLATSPIHLIATMRGKDQYEIEKDDRGKTSVKKLGVGAKQRDGFEYEFTCTFTVDQKTHMAEPQKDNTHIFENDNATLLTESHGQKIIKWANTSDIEPTRPKFTASTVQNVEDDIISIKKEIISFCTKLGGTKNVELMNALKEYVPSGNPNAIKDLEAAKECLAKVKEIKPVQA